MPRRVLPVLALFAFALLAARGERARPDHLIHLPGVAGEQNLDRQFLRGLGEGGYEGATEIFDWTNKDPGLAALLARERNEKQAAKFAEKLEKMIAADPDAKIRIVCHSGGAGIAVWALERLPEKAKIETLVLIAPALSQKYDLSKALSHVRGKAFALTSVNDVIILGAGTRVFGTIDGVKEEAAGLRGFTKPTGADDAQYEKLVAMPYQREWMELDNIGDHIGPMGRTFAGAIISPLVQGKNPPATRPTTQRTTQPSKSRR